ncbi:MFS transporter [Novosphingobium olei]|uniref:MFS transporter n=1 Tax=Novosphingobium olei TaxID=2728851 RepID=A0A7Y0BRU2_9SPHN|nr:MFS transporter [Novosphingobium olei]NML95411.1 MFS transporter [Novosphingobium olei]
MDEVARDPGAIGARVEGYSWYALGVLVLVCLLNFVDRQLLTILAVDIKRDLAIDDGQFGFLYGTAFGVFYALFGIPLGKLADRYARTRLLAIGLALWSGMTALSGLSRSFVQLGAARIGVGVGEATAGPCAYSLLADYFPPRRRATAIAIYSAGVYLGGGVSLYLGTSIASAWNNAFPISERPFGLAGWQAAFLAVGIPGLLLSAWVRSLREPVRGRYEGTPHPNQPGRQALRAFVADLGTIVPPFTLFAAARRGRASLVSNLIALALVAAAATLASLLLGDPLQWIALGTGVYAIISWASSLRLSDPAAYQVIWKSPTIVGLNIGYGLLSAVSYASAAFGPLFAMQYHAISPTAVALVVGGSAAAGGALGVVTGGALGDRVGANGSNSRRILIVIVASALSLVPNLVSLLTGSSTVFLLSVFPMWFLMSAGLGGASGAMVNLVPPSLRATATAAFFLGATILGLALGPYSAGRISTEFASLRVGLGAMLLLLIPAFVALGIAWRSCYRQEQARGA